MGSPTVRRARATLPRRAVARALSAGASVLLIGLALSSQTGPAAAAPRDVTAEVGGTASSEPAAWYVSFHGGADTASGVNQLYAYEAGGALVQSAVLAAGGASDPELSELRGMATTTSGVLLVANATQDDSAVLQYAAAEGDSIRPIVPPDGVLASASTAGAGLTHPYGLAVLPSGGLAVSSQDSQAVTLLTPDGLPDPPSGGASWWATQHPDADLPPGTLVPSSSDVRAEDGGLTAPRDILVAPSTTGDPTLYVADNGAQAVRSYDATTGRFLGDVLTADHDGLGSPVGLTLHDGRLYVSSEGTDDVMSLDLTTGKTHRVVSGKVDHLDLDHPSGLAFGSDGRLYVASRVAQRIIAYTLDEKGDSATAAVVFIDHLPDQPEELLALPTVSIGDDDPDDLASWPGEGVAVASADSADAAAASTPALAATGASAGLALTVPGAVLVLSGATIVAATTRRRHVG